MFYVQGEDREEYGPVGVDELRKWVSENRAGAGSLVRRESNTEWRRWEEFPELREILFYTEASTPWTPAPIRTRLAAYIADLSILSILWAVSILHGLPWIFDTPEQADYFFREMFFARTPNSLHFLLEGIFFGGQFLYFTWTHARGGQTLGKRFFHLQVVTLAGTPPGPILSSIRSLSFLLSSMLWYELYPILRTAN